MEAFAYRQFLELERVHWWFRGRRAIFDAVFTNARRARDPQRPLRSLDLGCGVGGNLDMLAAAGPAVGVDFDPGALRETRTRGHRVVRADGVRLPFSDASFDAVCALDALEHIDDDAAAARECARVLAPGGFLLVSGPSYRFLTTHQDAVVHHKRRYTIGAVKTLLRGAGLTFEHGSYINVFLFPPILVALLAIKLKQRIVPPGEDDHRSNASIPFPKPLNELLARIFALERHLVPHVPLPFGHSLIAVGRKPS